MKRDLITRWSNPAKYNITESGAILAARILRVEQSGSDGDDDQSSSSLQAGAVQGSTSGTGGSHSGSKRIDRHSPAAMDRNNESGWRKLDMSPIIDLGSSSFFDDIEEGPRLGTLSSNGSLGAEEDLVDEQLPLALRLHRQLAREMRVGHAGRTDRHLPAFRSVTNT